MKTFLVFLYVALLALTPIRAEQQMGVSVPSRDAYDKMFDLYGWSIGDRKTFNNMECFDKFLAPADIVGKNGVGISVSCFQKTKNFIFGVLWTTDWSSSNAEEFLMRPFTKTTMNLFKKSATSRLPIAIDSNAFVTDAVFSEINGDLPVSFLHFKHVLPEGRVVTVNEDTYDTASYIIYLMGNPLAQKGYDDAWVRTTLREIAKTVNDSHVTITVVPVR